MASRELLSISLASEYLDVSERTIRRYISEGRLPAFRVGGKTIRVKASDVAKLLEPIPAGHSIDAA